MTSITEQFDKVLSGAPGDLGPFYKQALEESPVFWSEAAAGWNCSVESSKSGRCSRHG